MDSEFLIRMTFYVCSALAVIFLAEALYLGVIAPMRSRRAINKRLSVQSEVSGGEQAMLRLKAQRGIDDRGAPLGRRNVGAHRDHLGAGVAELALRGPVLRLVAADDRELRTGLGESRGDGQADSAIAARDHRDAAGKVEARACHRPCRRQAA